MPRQKDHVLTVDELARSFVLTWLKATPMSLTDLVERGNMMSGIHYANRANKVFPGDVCSRKIDACTQQNIHNAVRELKKQNRIVHSGGKYHCLDNMPRFRTLDDEWES